MLSEENEKSEPFSYREKVRIFYFSGRLPVDIPTGWEPRAKQQPTGLIAYGAARRRPVQVLLSAITAKGKLPCKTKKTAIKSYLPCGADKRT